MDRSIKIGLASFALTMAALVGPTLAKAEASAMQGAATQQAASSTVSATDIAAAPASVIHR